VPEPGAISAAGFQQGQAQDRTFTGLQYQKLQQQSKQTGAALGHGLRASPDPEAQFSGEMEYGHSRNLSAAQFSGGGSARSNMTEEGE
jgi:hypothetical protein